MIDFITIDDMRHIIRNAACSAATDCEFPHAVQSLKVIETLEENYRQQLVKLAQIKCAVFRRYIRVKD